MNSTSTDLGVVMPRSRVDAPPLNGRNFQELVGLQAGVINSPSSGAGGRGGISFHGSTALRTNMMLDGVDMSFGEVNGAASFQAAGGGSTLINTVSVEAIEEFKSTANAYSAEYGRAEGGVLNVVTRSGSNDFHGTLFEFFRNDKLNANDFFSNKNGFAKSPLRRNQFGGNVEGPIKHDKIFFFLQLRRSASEATSAGNGKCSHDLAAVPAAACHERCAECNRAENIRRDFKSLRRFTYQGRSTIQQ